MGNCRRTGGSSVQSNTESKVGSPGLIFSPAPCCHGKSWQQSCLQLSSSSFCRALNVINTLVKSHGVVDSVIFTVIRQLAF